MTEFSPAKNARSTEARGASLPSARNPDAGQAIRGTRATLEVDRSIKAARLGARVTILVRGEAGQGKSTLLVEAADRATQSGFVVLALEGRAAERDIPYAGVRSLLTSYVPVVAPDASPMQRMVRALVTDFLPPDSPLAVCGAVNAWVDCLAPDDPCLICVDDADHLDEESMRVLSYVAARLPSGRIALVFTATNAVPLLTRIGATQYRLDDLDDESACRLLQQCGVTPVRQAEIIARLGGNPLALTFAAQATVSSLDPTCDLEPAPLHPRLEEDVRARVSELPPPTTYLLEAAAVSGSGDLAALSAWSEHRQLGAADALLPPAEDAGLITTHLNRLRWCRPWVAEAVVRLCPPGRRERLRGQLLGPASAVRRPSVVAYQLTRAEARVAQAVVDGASNRQAAQRLSVSEKTIDSHLQHIYRKLDVRSRSQLVVSLLTATPPDQGKGASSWDRPGCRPGIAHNGAREPGTT